MVEKLQVVVVVEDTTYGGGGGGDGNTICGSGGCVGE